MSAQSIASRSRQSHHPETDDALVARAVEFTTWARNNVRLIVTGAVLVALIVGGLIYYRMYQADRLERAAAELMQLEQTVGSGNTQLAQRELQQYIERFGGTVYADEARLVLGQLLLQEGQPAEAAAALDEIAGKVGRSALGAQGALLLAAAQQASGDTEAAVQTYLRVADNAEMSFRRIEALASAALLRSQTGDFAGAAELYRRAVELTEEGSLERSIYEMRLAEATAQAQ